MIPYGKQDIRSDDIELVVEVIKSDFLTQGPMVPRFEDALSGINAGKAAGSKVLALATTDEKSGLNADLVINDFSEINVQTLFEIL